jgi:hypothetical protein
VEKEAKCKEYKLHSEIEALEPVTYRDAYTITLTRLNVDYSNSETLPRARRRNLHTYMNFTWRSLTKFSW